MFVAGPIRAAVLNCYEDTLPAAGREAMERSPNLLVNVTNDAWFAGSAEGELHLRLAVLRAIETRRDLVRAVNQGPTTFVDAAGRVRARYDLPMPGTLPHRRRRSCRGRRRSTCASATHRSCCSRSGRSLVAVARRHKTPTGATSRRKGRRRDGEKR